MKKIHFIKMEATGNDYIYINTMGQQIPRPGELARQMSSRHRGVGGDGIVLIGKSTTEDCSMRIFNADGSEAEICGNALRCVGRYMSSFLKKKSLLVNTAAGPKEVTVGAGNEVTVQMGIPRLTPPEEIHLQGRQIRGCAVNLGNPHYVLFAPFPAASGDPVKFWGPRIERHPPRGVNVEFARVVNRREIELRVWERGSGETLSCGSGACAAAYAAFSLGLTGRKVTCALKGGDLTVSINQDDQTALSGEAREVFRGTWRIS